MPVCKKIWTVITTSLLIVLIALAAILFVPKLAGVDPYIVLSGSMEPKYPVGSVVYVKAVETDKIKVGEVITFYLTDQTTVTHRVTAINKEEQTFQTKGDANNKEDKSPVAFRDVIGVPVLQIPKLGILAKKLNTSSGKILYITAMIVVLLLMYIGDVLWSEEKVEVKHEK